MFFDYSIHFYYLCFFEKSEPPPTKEYVCCCFLFVISKVRKEFSYFRTNVVREKIITILFVSLRVTLGILKQFLLHEDLARFGGYSHSRFAFATDKTCLFSIFRMVHVVVCHKACICLSCILCVMFIIYYIIYLCKVRYVVLRIGLYKR